MTKKYNYPFTPSPFLPDLDALTYQKKQSSGVTNGVNSADFPEMSPEKESQEAFLLKQNDPLYPE